MKTKRLSIECPVTVAKALEEQAKAKGITFTAYMRLVVAQHAKTPLKIRVSSQLKKEARRVF